MSSKSKAFTKNLFLFQDNLTPEPVDMNDDDNFSSKYQKATNSDHPKLMHQPLASHQFTKNKQTAFYAKITKLSKTLHKMLPNWLFLNRNV